jgi:hypothetical protein
LYHFLVAFIWSLRNFDLWVVFRDGLRPKTFLMCDAVGSSLAEGCLQGLDLTLSLLNAMAAGVINLANYVNFGFAQERRSVFVRSGGVDSVIMCLNSVY